MMDKRAMEVRKSSNDQGENEYVGISVASSNICVW